MIAGKRIWHRFSVSILYEKNELILRYYFNDVKHLLINDYTIFKYIDNLNCQIHFKKNGKEVDEELFKYLTIKESPIYLMLCMKKKILQVDLLKILNEILY